MRKTPQNEQLSKIGNLISSKLNKFEFLFFIIFLIGIFLKLATDLNANILIILSLNALAVLYFFSAFSVSDDKNAGRIELLINKLLSLSLSITTMGILFRLQHWPGFSNMIIIGCVTLIILLPIILIIESKKADLVIFNHRRLLRVAVIIAFGLIINFAPKDILIKAGIDKKTNIENIE